MPSKNIVINNYTVFGGCSGVAIGSEMSGGVENVTIENSYWYNTKSAPIKFKSCMGRGAFIKNIVYNNLIIRRTVEEKEPYNIYLEGDYDSRNPLCGNKNITAAPSIHDITISNIDYESSMLPAADFRGLLESSITNVKLENVNMKVPSNDTSKTYDCEYVHGSYKNTIPQPCS